MTILTIAGGILLAGLAWFALQLAAAMLEALWVTISNIGRR